MGSDYARTGGPKRFDGFFFSLLFFGIALRLYGIDRSFGTDSAIAGSYDEAVDFRVFNFHPIEYILAHFYIPILEGCPGLSPHIFNSVVIRLMIVLFGEESEIAVRFPYFLAGVATLFMIYLLAWRFFDSPAVARISLLFAALNPIHINYSQVARGYSLVMFFFTLALFSMLRILENRSWRG